MIAGDYPDGNDMSQMTLIVDSRNQIPLKALKELGFYQDTDNVDEEYAEENPITFDEILNKKYKVFTNSDLVAKPFIIIQMIICKKLTTTLLKE